MRRIGERLQLFGIPPRTTRVFRRSHPGSFQRAGIASLWISRGDTLDFDAVLPSIAEVVEVVEGRSEEHTSELQSLMRISYAVFCLKKKKNHQRNRQIQSTNVH